MAQSRPVVTQKTHDLIDGRVMHSVRERVRRVLEPRVLVQALGNVWQAAGEALAKRGQQPAMDCRIGSQRPLQRLNRQTELACRRTRESPLVQRPSKVTVRL